MNHLSTAWESFKAIPPYWSNIISLVGFIVSFVLFWFPRPKFVRRMEKEMEKDIVADMKKEKEDEFKTP